MGQKSGDLRRIARRVVAALAVGDLAYRMFVRETVRRRLGIEARASGGAVGRSAVLASLRPRHSHG